MRLYFLVHRAGVHDDSIARRLGRLAPLAPARVAAVAEAGRAVAELARRGGRVGDCRSAARGCGAREALPIRAKSGRPGHLAHEATRRMQRCPARSHVRRQFCISIEIIGIALPSSSIQFSPICAEFGPNMNQFWRARFNFVLHLNKPELGARPCF